LETAEACLRDAEDKAASFESQNAALKGSTEEFRTVIRELEVRLKKVMDLEVESTEIADQLRREAAARQRDASDNLKIDVHASGKMVEEMQSHVIGMQQRTSPSGGDKFGRSLSPLLILSNHSSSAKSSSRDQRVVLNADKVAENMLTDFMDEVIGIASSAETEMVSMVQWMGDATMAFQKTPIRALDLAGQWTPHELVSNLQRKLEALSLMVAKVVQELRLRQQQFGNHTSECLTPPKTPDEPGREKLAKLSRLTGEEVVRQMKLDLQEKILTPCRNNAYDPVKLQAIVGNLESKMDVLLNDLEKANAALRDKDILFFEMEQLVAQNDGEKAFLEEKLRAVGTELGNLHRSSASCAVGMGSKETQGFYNESKAAASQIAGARLLCMTLEKRNKLDASSAFRKWSCTVGVVKAISSQKSTAAALAQQLEITREKLIVLRSHLKRGKQPQTADDRNQPRLRRLLDRMDKRDKHSFHDNGEHNENEIMEI